jgi:hypothetical protein
MHDGCQIVHWGDYDPIGITEYLRTVRACPNRVTFYAPLQIEDLLARYGKRKLIIEQTHYLDRLRDKIHDPIVHRMIDLFDRYRRGLEQEILLRHPEPASLSC